MKAAVLYNINDLRIQQVPKPQPSINETLIKVACCGICSSDIPRIKQDGTHRFPLIPGHEYSGYNCKGDLVAVYPLLPCYECSQCKSNRYQCCSAYNYTGSRCDGGFAEYVKVPKVNLISVPAKLSPQESALTEPAAVAMHAVRNVQIKGGERVIVLGCGTIGLIAAQIAQVMGAEVIPLDIRQSRLELAKHLGFKRAMSTKNTSKDLMDYADVVLEMVGLSKTYNLAIDLVRAGGRIILTGNISENLTVPRKRVSQILRKELTVKGNWNSIAISKTISDWKLVLKYQAENKITVKPLISHEISIDELPRMINRMAQGKGDFGKVIVNI